MNRNAETHALLDRVGEGMETASRLQVSRARCRRCRADGYERRKVAHRFHATALPYMQCMPCNARIACMACATRMPRKARVTRSDRTILLCTKSRLPAQIKKLSQVHVSER